MITIVLAEDHALVRQKLKRLLETQADFRVVAEAASGEEAVELAQRLTPQVLVTDLIMPRLTGIEAARLLLQTHPGIKIVVVSIHFSLPYITQALQSGVLGYLSKDCVADHLIKAVRAVIGGQRYIHPPLAEAPPREEEDVLGEDHLQMWDLLTQREKEILHHLNAGKSDQEIASVMNLPVSLATNHCGNLMRKLRFRNRLEMLAFLKSRKPPGSPPEDPG